MNLKLETDRLFLREILPSDAEAMFLLDSNPNVHLYLGNNPVTSIDQCSGYIENIRNQYQQNGIGRFAVVLKETNETIGWAGLKFITEHENNHVDYYDIGYRLQENHWGKGYGFEAAKKWLEYAFEEMKVPAVYASAHIDNIGSNTILQKIGLQQNGQYLHHDIPCYWYELTLEEYSK
ncbi:GNAT family N-acetyltransferase [Flavobacterium humi]|uniref:N-acetyltransferase n=1 Tax=Flavobacterium humi TaxID=2562683 RepID=A0A4Z0LCP3_9FLAO|nr:GNAT family N-acetyltransferase [Flavobacterium humi]TGD59648.1 N-acetyltransferase [Flavobacterium humi]